MTISNYVKRYRTAAQAHTAYNNWAWLCGLDSGIVLPQVRIVDQRSLSMDRLTGDQPAINDLGTVAEALARLHRAAYQRIGLHPLGQPFTDPSGLIVADFVTPRRRVLAGIDLAFDELAPAIYKDANIRNFILTSAGVAAVDFDDLTLAPVGYDLAKLVVSAAMTYGPISPAIVDEVLDAYNHAIGAVGVVCHRRDFDTYADLHGELTAPYLGRNGYRHLWTPTMERR